MAHRRRELLGAGGRLRSTTTSTKSTDTDPVTLADTECEQLLRAELDRLRPDDAVLGEEGGGDRTGGAGLRWVLDPIDGTVNFLYGLAPYAVSVGVQRDGVSVAGAVVDVTTDRVFAAARGHGATLDGQPLRCTDTSEVRLALVLTGFGYAPERRALQGALLARVLPQVRDVRRSGCASLDVCAVAAGEADAYFEHGTNPWAWAAAALVAEEAGAVVHTPGPDVFSAVGALVVVAAPGVDAALRDLLATHTPAGLDARCRQQLAELAAARASGSTGAGAAGSAVPRVSSRPMTSGLGATSLNVVPSATSTTASALVSCTSSAQGRTSATVRAALSPLAPNRI